MKKILLPLFAVATLVFMYSSCEKENQPPTIQSTIASPQKIKTGATTQLTYYITLS